MPQVRGQSIHPCSVPLSQILAMLLYIRYILHVDYSNIIVNDRSHIVSV